MRQGMKAPKRATIVDVARHAGVSLGTASQALNNPEQVGEERLARVKQAIAELGYTRNALAQGLRAKRSSAIGLCVPHSLVSLFSALVYRFEELAFAEGLEIMHVLSHEAAEKELDRVKTLVSYGVEGVLLIPSARPKATVDFLAERNVPTVIVNRPLAGDTRFDQVTVDNRGLMETLAGQLIALGHRRILLVCRRRAATVTVHRVEGLAKAVRATRASVQTHVIEAGETEAEFAPRLPAAMAEFAPTAIIAGNDVIAAWVLRQLDRLGLACPSDVSVAVFDEPPWAEIVRPRLSTVRLAVDEMADTAWKMLVTRIKDPNQPGRASVAAAEIHLRESVAEPTESKKGSTSFLKKRNKKLHP